MGIALEESGHVPRGSGSFFSFTKTRVLLQESDFECRRLVEELSKALGNLLDTRVRIDGGEDSAEEKVRQSQVHLGKLMEIEEQMKSLVDMVRARGES